ncbi:hypothetical protein ACJRO0_04860 [Acetobacter oryzifermentans]|uniref:hypothetical protein n=1 Tax=Acetobacter oryzifermentans TaxID=1633874 RepID=UPI0039BF0831
MPRIGVNSPARGDDHFDYERAQRGSIRNWGWRVRNDFLDRYADMTAPTNWPDPNRPGVPMFPEQDGFHIIGRLAWKWHAASKLWDGVANPDEFGTFYYVGPCITPTQINEMLTAERERCAKECDAIATFASSDWKATAYDSDNRAGDAAEETAEICAQKIRNLGAAS